MANGDERGAAHNCEAPKLQTQGGWGLANGVYKERGLNVVKGGGFTMMMVPQICAYKPPECELVPRVRVCVCVWKGGLRRVRTAPKTHSGIRSSETAARSSDARSSWWIIITHAAEMGNQPSTCGTMRLPPKKKQVRAWRQTGGVCFGEQTAHRM